MNSEPNIKNKNEKKTVKSILGINGSGMDSGLESIRNSDSAWKNAYIDGVKPLKSHNMTPWAHMGPIWGPYGTCLLYTSDAADEEDSVDLGGRRIIKKTW